MKIRPGLLFACLALCQAAAVAAGDLAVIRLGELPLLLVDDAGIESRRNLVRRVHPGLSLPQPVLQPESPWEGERVYVFGTVRYNPDRKFFEMWYVGLPSRGEVLADTAKVHVTGFKEGGATLQLYATSKDGKKWDRPNLGLHEFAGSKQNNIIFDLDSPAVIVDAFEKNPAHRYKMVGASGRNYYSATSPDGLTWSYRPAGGTPIFPYSDTITMTQDPVSGEFLVYLKKPQIVRGFDRRVVWLSRSRNFVSWSEPQLVLSPDEIDDLWATRPGERTEFYNMTVFPHAGGFIGLPTALRVEYELPRSAVGKGQSPIAGPIDVEIASSLDGAHWQRSWPRGNVIPHGAPGTFNGGAILGLASSPVSAGKETWVYYTVLTTNHGGPMPPKRISIARADWRRDGFVSLDAGPESGRLETKPVRLASARLVVNADAQRGGVRAGIVEADGRVIAGLGLAECEPLQSDSVAGVMRWKSGALPPTDRPIKILLELTSTRLFSLGTYDYTQDPRAAP
ncbi:MAG: hypothetical protein EXS38_01665 [Opitutus sp.]|nr:hypothetical protein [Opitutus sp.]